MQVSFHYEWPCYSIVLFKILLTCIRPENFPSVSVKVQVTVVKYAALCVVLFCFVAGKHEPPLERESESFFIIWEIPVHFEDVWNHYGHHTTRTPSKGITMFPRHRTIDENVEYASHWSISQAQSGHWDQVSRTLSQGLSQVFLVVSPRVHPQCTHTICFWTASGCCFCNRCNFMVNVLYLPFATSVAVHRRPLASEEVCWANFSWEEKLESSSPLFFFLYPLREIR